MARDITALGALGTGTVTRSGSAGDSDLFNLEGRAQQLRATDWYTFSLPATANSLIIRSTGGSDMVGGLFAGTIGPTSDYDDLGSPLAFNDDGGANSNFQISRTNQGRGAYTVAVQKFGPGAANYTLEIVAVVRTLQTRDASVTLETGLPTVSLAAERVAATVPARPSRPTASVASLTSLSVSWSAPDGGGPPITAYAVRYRVGGSGPWTAWPFTGTGTTTTITGLTARTGYQVQVRARNRIGWGSYSLSASGNTTPAPTAPDMPAAPAVRGASTSSLNVSWVAPSTGGAAIEDYDVQYRAGTSGSWITWPHVGIGTTTTITGLTARTGYQVRVRAGNSIGESQWSPPGAATTEAIMATVTLEIDWDNDGTFGHPAADVTGDLVKHSLRTTRGRTLQSRRKAVAGRLEAKLWNIGAKYDPINSSSPIYERVIAGAGVRVKMAGTVVWGGILDTPRYRNRPVPQLDIIALGLLSTLRQPVSVATQANKSIGEIAKLVAEAVGIERAGLAGSKVLDRWTGVSDQDALGVLQDLEETEEGFLNERADGALALEAENARSTGASMMAALTLTDEVVAATDIPILEGSALDWGYRQIANVVRVPVTPLVAGANVITLWFGSHIAVGAHVIYDLLIGYPEEDYLAPRDHRGVVSWIEPVAGTDYTAQTGLSITGRVEGDGYLLRFGNSTNNEIAVGDLKVRGTPLVAENASQVTAKDAASVSVYGEREWARPAPLFTTVAAAQQYADGIVDRQSTPQGWLVARWPAQYAVEQARTLGLSRRVTVLRLGETKDYYIEGIGLALRGYSRMEYLLSPVPGVTVPSAPVANPSGNFKRLEVSWTEPYSGGSPLTGYDVRYKKSTDDSWTDWPHVGTGRTATITGLEVARISYDVEVRARNDQGGSAWSARRSSITFYPLNFRVVTISQRSASGIAWDGKYYRVVYWYASKVYTFNQDGKHIPGEDFDFASGLFGARGITWDGTYYRIMGSDDKVYAHNSAGTHVPSKDFTVGTFTVRGRGSRPTGITWDGTYYRILDQNLRRVYAYDADGRYVSRFSLPSSGNYQGLTWDGTYLRIIDANRVVVDYHVLVHPMVVAYELDGTHESDEDFTVGQYGGGITWDGTYYQILNWYASRVMTYNSDGTRAR